MSVDERYLVETLRELVRVPSPPGGEEAVARLVASKLRELGVDYEVDEYHNVIAWMGSGRPRLMINAHLDTVPPGDGWTIDPFSGELIDGRVYGRGASDNKAGVASMLAIAKALRDHVGGQLVLLFTSREEGGDKDEARRGLKDKVKVDAGICLDYHIDSESKVCEVVVGCRGIANVRVKVRGRAWHSSEPERGVNAIYGACELIRRVREAPLRALTSPIPVREDVSVTRIEGGEWATMIPDRCSLTINYRLLPDLDPDDAVRRVVELASGLDVEVELASGSRGYMVDPSTPIARAAMDAARSEGFKAEPTVARGWLDAAQLSRLLSAPVICIGTMTRGQAHVKDEYVKVSDLVSGARVALKAVQLYMGVEGRPA
ncbi:hypothetical protein B6U99_04790 [Candidatus Geothermarchaeota archaeon ex4572_27]|nr:MAG: hypothetical protein B6U99_04790 [Candidatus Geothermarchaeota archaeon ex4572_27]